MKSLLLEFAETPDKEDSDPSLVSYSDSLNLTVIKGTSQPAISFINNATETFTKSKGETTDSDKDVRSIQVLMGTSTYTTNKQETSDSDPMVREIKNLITTQTITESRESSDSDK